MKVFYCFVFMLCCSAAQSQNLQEKEIRYQKILKNPKQYLFGEGFGKDPDIADQQALQNLVSQISVSVQAKFNEISAFDNKGNSDTKVQSIVSTYSSTTLKQTKQIIVDQKDTFKVLRYIQKKDLQKVFEERYQKIQNFVENADKYLKEAKISDALRYYYWALLLLNSHPDANSLKYLGNILATYLPKKISDILKDIRIKVLTNEERKGTQSVALQFYYKAMLVSNLQYKYDDGNQMSNLMESNEGKGYLKFDIGANEKNKQAKIMIEYKFEDEAKQDKEIEQVVKAVINKPSFFRPSRKIISLDISKKDTMDFHQDFGVNKLTQKSVNFSVPSKIKKSKKNALPNCKKTLQSALKWMKKGNYEKIKQYCNSDGEKLITQLFQYGNAALLPFTEARFTTIQKDNTLQIRSVPMAFSFKNSVKNFTENVVFYFDEHQKIADMTFALNPKTYDKVMDKKGWTINQKITLINFMEHYKTAYALKRLDYIESIFSNDALIIVGHVLENTHTLEKRYKQNKIVKENKYTKKQFIKHLAHTFKSKEFINLKFEDITFKRSGRYEAGFGVQVKQNYVSSNYADQGYLFLLVDLKYPEKPMIHVRTWQAEKGKKGIYDIGDF